MRWVISSKGDHYRTYHLKKKSGWRRVDAPRTYIKVVQHWILDNILSKIECHNCAHGFISGRSPLTNAQAHIGANFILNIDVSNFFGSINREMAFGVFRNIGFSSEISKYLMELATYDGRLPQGAPTSPCIANLYLRDFDELVSESLPAELTYTRYADDISLSSKSVLDRGWLDFLSDRLADSGLRVNSKKTKWLGPGDRLEVTGYVIGSALQKPRYWRKRTRALLHRAEVDADYRGANYQQINGMVGMIEGMAAANAGNCLHRQASRVRALLSKAG